MKNVPCKVSVKYIIQIMQIFTFLSSFRAPFWNLCNSLMCKKNTLIHFYSHLLRLCCAHWVQTVKFRRCHFRGPSRKASFVLIGCVMPELAARVGGTLTRSNQVCRRVNSNMLSRGSIRNEAFGAVQELWVCFNGCSSTGVNLNFDNVHVTMLSNS